MSGQLDKIKDGHTPTAHTLKAIELFLAKRDIRGAIAELKKTKDPNNGLWHYNMAFLYGYSGNLKAAARHYHQGSLHPIEPGPMSEIEEFICFIAREEPDKYQLNYCLGLFNWKTKGDRIQAKKDFQAFADNADGVTFVKEQELVASWIASDLTTL